MKPFLKNEIRKSILDIRNKHKISYTSLLEVNQRFLEVLTPYLSSCKVIAAYYPISSELDIKPLLKTLSKKSIKIVLPFIEDENLNMNFYEWLPEMSMKPSEIFNSILQPQKQELTHIPDIVIAPLVACDILGNRIGMGKGVYDKKIFQLRALKTNLIYVGLGYDFQLLDEVPKESHDQKLDIIITEERTIILNSR